MCTMANVSEMPSAQNAEQHESLEQLMTVEEVALLLRKSPDQLRWMIRQQTAPKSALIARRRVFRRSDVKKFIDEAFAEAK